MCSNLLAAEHKQVHHSLGVCACECTQALSLLCVCFACGYFYALVLIFLIVLYLKWNNNILQTPFNSLSEERLILLHLLAGELRVNVDLQFGLDLLAVLQRLVDLLAPIQHRTELIIRRHDCCVSFRLLLWFYGFYDTHNPRTFCLMLLAMCACTQSNHRWRSHYRLWCISEFVPTQTLYMSILRLAHQVEECFIQYITPRNKHVTWELFQPAKS